MRLYSRKHFLLAMVCILPIIRECKNYDGAMSLLWIGFFGYMMVRCIITSFSKELVEKDEANAELDRRVRQMLFGPLWKVPPILFMLAPIFVGAILFSVLWPSEWAGIVLFFGMVGSVVLALWFNVKYRDLMEREQQNNEDAKS